MTLSVFSFFFFFNDTATTEIYTLSLHDALPISGDPESTRFALTLYDSPMRKPDGFSVTLSPFKRPTIECAPVDAKARSEEHTSELQSQSNLVCRLLLEKKKKIIDHGRL